MCHEKLLRVTYVKIAPAFAEETESFEKPNVSQGSSGASATRKLQMFLVSL